MRKGSMGIINSEASLDQMWREGRGVPRSSWLICDESACDGALRRIPGVTTAATELGKPAWWGGCKAEDGPARLGTCTYPAGQGCEGEREAGWASMAKEREGDNTRLDVLEYGR